MHHPRTAATFSIVMTVLVVWALLFYLIGPETIVEYFGVENTYLIAFIVAIVGGVSIAGSAPVYATVVTFVLGGASPLLLGIATGTGVVVNDLLFFYAAMLGRDVIAEGKWKGRIDRFSRWISARPRWMLILGVYVYCAFTPLPNDVLAVSLALAGVKLSHVVIPMLLGSITLITIVAVAAQYGMQLGS